MISRFAQNIPTYLLFKVSRKLNKEIFISYVLCRGSINLILKNKHQIPQAEPMIDFLYSVEVM